MLYLFVFLIGNLLMVRAVLKQNTALVPLIFVPVLILVVYLGFVFNCAVVAFDLLMLSSIVGFVLYLKALCFEPKQDGRYIFVLVSIALLAWLYLLSTGMTYVRYDAFNFWGLRGHALFVTNHLPNKSSLNGHLEYPMGSPIWQYIVFKAAGKWSMPLGLWAQLILLFAPLCAVFLFKPWHKGLLLFFVASFLLVYFDKHALSNIYVDNLLSTWTAGVVIAFYAMRDRWQPRLLLCFLPALMLLVLFKPAGIFFAFFALAIIFAELISSKQVKVNWPWLLSLLVAVVAVKYMWGLYISHHGFVKTLNFSQHADSLSIWRSLFFPQDTFHQAVLHKFFMALVWDRRVDRAHSTALVLTIAFLVFWYLLQRRKNKQSFVPSNTVLFVIAVFAVLYFIGVLFIYLNVLSKSEGLGLASYSRYMRIFYLAIYFMTMCLLLAKFAYSKTYWKWGSVSLMFIFVLASVASKGHVWRYYKNFAKVQALLKSQKVNPRKDRVVFLWQQVQPYMLTPRVAYDLIYFPKRYNTSINQCEKIIFKSASEPCHLSYQQYIKTINQHADYLVVVNASKAELKGLGLPDKLMLITKTPLKLSS